MHAFKWHLMADEQPTDNDASYVVVGKRGAMYLAGHIHDWGNGRRTFYIQNNRSSFMEFEKVKAWAEIPPFIEKGEE